MNARPHAPPRGHALPWVLGLLGLFALLGCGKETVRVKAQVSGFGSDAAVTVDTVASPDTAGGSTDSDATVGNDAAPGCVAGTTRCEGGQRQRCDASGAWQAEPCAADAPYCLVDACVACAPGQGRCAASGHERCDDDGAWQADPCPASKPVCDASVCKVCAPSQVSCLDAGGVAQVAVCNAKGTDFDQVTPCKADQACKQGVCQVCLAGATRCEDGARQRCQDDGGGWLADPCASATPLCLAGQCALCTPGEVRCTPLQADQGAGPGRQTCAGDGLSWVDSAPCPGIAVCSEGACKACLPGEARCVGGKRLVCAADGAGLTLDQDCAKQGLVCANAGCSCVPGLACSAALPGQAASSSLLSCAFGGNAGTITKTCGEEGVCVGQTCALCQPGALACMGDQVTSCKPDGSGLALQQDCAAAGGVCVKGACVAPCSEAAGEVGCGFAAIDPPRTDPSPSAPPATLVLLARNTTIQAQSTSWAGAAATAPSGSSAPGSGSSAPPTASTPLIVGLQGLGAVPGGAATTTGPAPALGLATSAAASGVIAIHAADGSSGELMALPGRPEAGAYRVAAWPSQGVGAEGWIAVLAGGAPVSLTLTLPSTTATAATPMIQAGPGVPALAAGGAAQLSVPAGAALVLLAAPSADLTGVQLVADNPITLWVGHRAARVPAVDRCLKPDGTGPGQVGSCQATGGLCFVDADCAPPCCGDALLTALPPVARWGTVHVVGRSVSRGKEADAVRVVADQDGTVVVTEPALGPPAILGAGEALDLHLPADVVIVATGKVAVLQLLAGGGATGLGAAAQGDPAMALLPPVERWSQRAELWVPAAGWAQRHLTLVAAKGMAWTLDGVAGVGGVAIGGSGFVAWRMPLAAGSHALRCGGPCAALVHGYGTASGFASVIGAGP